MNVSGVGATPPQPPLPPVAPVATATSPAPSDARSSGDPQPGRRRADTRAHDAEPKQRAEAPPLRMLTVTEMRIMLGQLPVSAGLKPEHHGVDPAPAG